jgi:hypothetical protein
MFVPITIPMISTPKVYKPTLSMRLLNKFIEEPLDEGRIGLAFGITIDYVVESFRLIVN